MAIELSLMVISAAVIAFLYLHKYFELKHGVTTAVHAVRRKADPVIESAKEKANQALSHLTLYHVSIFLHDLFVYAARFFMHLSRRVHDSSSRLAERATKRKENLSKGRAASFYLKQIHEAKNDAEMPEDSGKGETR